MTERARTITAERLSDRLPVAQPGERDGPARIGLQRDARPPRGIVRSDAAFHRRRLARTAHTTDGYSQRRRSRPARPSQRGLLSQHHRQHAGGSRSTLAAGRSAARALACGHAAATVRARHGGLRRTRRRRRVSSRRAGRGERADARRSRRSPRRVCAPTVWS